MTARQVEARCITAAYNMAMSVDRRASRRCGRGFGLRTVARTVAGAVPGFGWALSLVWDMQELTTSSRRSTYARKIAQKRDGGSG